MRGSLSMKPHYGRIGSSAVAAFSTRRFAWCSQPVIKGDMALAASGAGGLRRTTGRSSRPRRGVDQCSDPQVEEGIKCVGYENQVVLTDHNSRYGNSYVASPYQKVPFGSVCEDRAAIADWQVLATGWWFRRHHLLDQRWFRRGEPAHRRNEYLWYISDWCRLRYSSVIVSSVTVSLFPGALEDGASKPGKPIHTQ